MVKFLAFVNFYCKLLEKLMLSMLLMMCVAMFIMILGRYIPFIPPFLWTMEVVQFSMIWMIFFGTALGVREKSHFFVNVVPERYEKVFGNLLYVVYVGVMLFFSYIYIVYGYIYWTKWNMIQNSEIMGINMGFVYFPVPLCGVSCLLFLVEDLVERMFAEKGEVQA